MVTALSGVSLGAPTGAVPTTTGARLAISTVVTSASIFAESASPQASQAKTDMETATRDEASPPMPLKKPTSSGMPSMRTVSAR